MSYSPVPKATSGRGHRGFVHVAFVLLKMSGWGALGAGPEVTFVTLSALGGHRGSR